MKKQKKKKEKTRKKVVNKNENEQVARVVGHAKRVANTFVGVQVLHVSPARTLYAERKGKSMKYESRFCS